MEKATYRTLIQMFDELRGERVLVRPYRTEDAQALFEAVGESRDHLRPWMPFADAHQTVEESMDWINEQRAKWILREAMNVGIWEVGGEEREGRYLGGTGLYPHNWGVRYFEIGYWLRKSAQGHGYMAEAVRLLVDFAFHALEARRVEIKCDENNGRSAAVAVRLGFVREGCLRNDTLTTAGELRSTLVFSRVPGDL